MKQIILKWLNHIEAQLKKSKQQIQKTQKKPKQKTCLDKHLLSGKQYTVSQINDGSLSAKIMTDNKDVIIRISGFKDFKRALDWAQLQSVLWRSEQQSRELIQEDLKPKITIH